MVITEFVKISIRTNLNVMDFVFWKRAEKTSSGFEKLSPNNCNAQKILIAITIAKLNKEAFIYLESILFLYCYQPRCSLLNFVVAFFWLNVTKWLNSVHLAYKQTKWTSTKKKKRTWIDAAICRMYTGTHKPELFYAILVIR